MNEKTGYIAPRICIVETEYDIITYSEQSLWEGPIIVQPEQKQKYDMET